MRLWPPLIVPPLAFLGALAFGLAVVGWECETQHRFGMHVVAFGCLMIAFAGIALAWRDWRSAGAVHPGDEADAAVQVRFISVLGLGLSSLVALATVTLWVVVLIIPPCVR